MAGGGAGEHDEFDRRFFAGLLVVLGLLVAGVALVHRTGMAHRSQPGDACTLTSRGSLVAFDARTGEVVWTNAVPPDGRLARSRSGDSVELRTLRGAGADGQFRSTTRTIDAATGAVAGCRTTTETMATEDLNVVSGYDDPLVPPVVLDGLTIVNWGDGVRATDPDDTGVWGVAATDPQRRIGDDLIAATTTGGRAGAVRLDLRTGAERWRIDQQLVFLRRAGGLVLTTVRGEPGRIAGHGLATGAERWSTVLPLSSHELKTGNWNTEAYDLGPLVVFPVGDGAHLIALDAATGEIRWNTDGGSPGTNRRYPEPGYVHDVVLSPDGTTVIAAVDAMPPPDDDD